MYDLVCQDLLLGHSRQYWPALSFAYGYADIAEYFIEKARCRTVAVLSAVVERTCGVSAMVRQGADDTIANETGKTAREGIR